jgi:hypothetical protein
MVLRNGRKSCSTSNVRCSGMVGSPALLVMMYIYCMFYRTIWDIENKQPLFTFTSRVPWWPWLYGSWIYNYLCNQCLSPLLLWVQISIRVRCTTLCVKVCQWLATGLWFSPGPRYEFKPRSWRSVFDSGFLHQ